MEFAVGVCVGLVIGLVAGLIVADWLRRDVDTRRAPATALQPVRAANGEPFPYQPPVIVLAAPREETRQEVHYHVHQSGPPAVSQRAAELARYPGPASQHPRVFRVVGQREEWVE